MLFKNRDTAVYGKSRKQSSRNSPPLRHDCTGLLTVKSAHVRQSLLLDVAFSKIRIIVKQWIKKKYLLVLYALLDRPPHFVSFFFLSKNLLKPILFYTETPEEYNILFAL